MLAVAASRMQVQETYQVCLTQGVGVQDFRTRAGLTDRSVFVVRVLTFGALRKAVVAFARDPRLLDQGVHLGAGTDVVDYVKREVLPHSAYVRLDESGKYPAEFSSQVGEVRLGFFYDRRSGRYEMRAHVKNSRMDRFRESAAQEDIPAGVVERYCDLALSQGTSVVIDLGAITGWLVSAELATAAHIRGETQKLASQAKVTWAHPSGLEVGIVIYGVSEPSSWEVNLGEITAPVRTNLLHFGDNHTLSVALKSGIRVYLRTAGGSLMTTEQEIASEWILGQLVQEGEKLWPHAKETISFSRSHFV